MRFRHKGLAKGKSNASHTRPLHREYRSNSHTDAIEDQVAELLYVDLTIAILVCSHNHLLYLLIAASSLEV
jgi:hypothetical protein